MKYLLLIIILFACKHGPGKPIVAHNDQAKINQETVRPDISSIDIHDPYFTGKDTLRLNKVMDKIFKLSEVKAINTQIFKTSKGTHGVAIMVQDKFNGDTSYYHFKVGDNSHKDRFVNVYDFLFDKRTGQIKAYDSVLDTIMSMKDWRKTTDKDLFDNDYPQLNSVINQ